MIRILTSSLCVLLLVPAIANANDALARRLDQQVQQLAEDGFSGVVLVARGEQIVLHKGYGTRDPKTRQAMPRDAVFTIGSITKPLTAVVLMRLVEAGKLTVGDRLSKFFPAVPNDKRNITLHQLLTHSAGLPSALGSDFDYIDRDAYLARAMATPLLFAPGESYEYSNVGYSVLAAVIEKVSGKTYPEMLRREVLEPAGMSDTGLSAELWPRERLARGVSNGSHWGTVVERLDERGPSWHLMGNGGLHSTATDIWRFHRALLDDSLLSSETRAKVFAPHVARNRPRSTFYSYGWVIVDQPTGRLVTHNGGNDIFFADLRRYVDHDVMAFVACNRMVQGVERLAKNLAETVLSAAPTSKP